MWWLFISTCRSLVMAMCSPAVNLWLPCLLPDPYTASFDRSYRIWTDPLSAQISCTTPTQKLLLMIPLLRSIPPWLPEKVPWKSTRKAWHWHVQARRNLSLTSQHPRRSRSCRGRFRHHCLDSEVSKVEAVVQWREIKSQHCMQSRCHSTP